MSNSTIQTNALPSVDENVLVIDGLPGYMGLYYQPEFDLKTGLVTACESLLRWWHPDFGMLSPNASLRHSKWDPWLERAEHWAVGATCRQSAAWASDGREIQVALNVSRRMLADPSVPEVLDAALADSGADPSYISLDVPLSAFTRQRLTTLPTTLALADAGITIVADGVAGDVRHAIDGAPVSVHKIDVHAAGRRRSGLHRSVAVALQSAHELGAVAVAKAVETSADLGALRAMGFDRAFGHVFCPAVTPSELLEQVDLAARLTLDQPLAIETPSTT